MGNRLFQEAIRFVEKAKRTDPSDRNGEIAIAQNAISSAYANSTAAEQQQLSGLQKDLDSLS